MHVFKYKLYPGQNTLDLPKDFKILTIGCQDNQVVIWALVDPEADKVSTTIYLALTGENLSHVSLGGFIGTTTDKNGFVFHAFIMYVEPL